MSPMRLAMGQVGHGGSSAPSPMPLSKASCVGREPAREAVRDAMLAAP